MPPLDPGVLERLRVARFELEDGRRELVSLTKAGAYKAIKSFHDALETFLVALTHHLDIPQAFRNFHEYPKVISAHTTLPFKHRTVLDNVNALRTPAKHSALYPEPESVRQLSSQ